MNDIVTCDLSGKVILTLDEFIEINDELKFLRQERVSEENKYSNLIKYLFSECNVKKYASGKRYLEYDAYNNHLADYLKEIEPDKYDEKIDNFVGEDN